MYRHPQEENSTIKTPLKKADTRKSEFPGKFQKSDQLVVHI